MVILLFNSILDLIGNTPVIKLNNILENEYDTTEIFLKLENLNIGGSVKDRAALNMIEEAEKSGLLNKNSVILEPTSGNLGISLAFIGTLKGYKTIIIMPDTMSIERRNILKALGAEVLLTDGARGMKGAINKAMELTKKNKNYFMLHQFTNPANVDIHYKTTAEEIIKDVPDIDIFIAGIGSGGTIGGVSKRLKEYNPAIKIIAVEPSDSAVLSGERPGKHQIQGIGPGFIPDILDLDLIDDVTKISDEEAFEFCKLIATKNGLLLGISTGANVAAAYKAIKKYGADKKIVTIASDGGEKYLSIDLYR